MAYGVKGFLEVHKAVVDCLRVCMRVCVIALFMCLSLNIWLKKTGITFMFVK